MKTFHTDLHIHTCLSPCADWGMTPRRIVEKSLAASLDLIAVCDHNSVENAGAAMREGKRLGLPVLPGMEVCSREEVHLLAVFDELDQAEAMQEFVYGNLAGENRPEIFGYQIVANEQDEVLGENPRLLIGAIRAGLGEIAGKIRDLAGLCFACHVDRAAFGLISQLGFIPGDLPLDGIEISFRTSPSEAKRRFPVIGGRPCITSSDAHFPEEIGRAKSKFRLLRPSTAEIRLALREMNGRSVEA